MSTKWAPFGASTYNLQSSISSTATSIILSSFLEPVTGTAYTMALLNTDIAYGTIAPKTTNSEFISFTGITQNADGTATLTGVTRGLAKKYPFTSDSAYKLPHSGQTQFIISDAPQVFNKYVSLEDAETITGKKTFPGGGDANAPVSGTVYSAPTNNLEYASKRYTDLVAGGIAITNQILVSGTAGENLTVGYVVGKQIADGKWYIVKANNSTTFSELEIGIAQATVLSGASVNILISGIDSNQSGLVAGTEYFCTDAGGLVTSSFSATNLIFVGYGQSATQLLVQPRNIDFPLHTEKQALAGSAGTPGSANKYITQSDVSAAGVSGLIVRATGTALPALSAANLTNFPFTLGAGAFGGTGADGALSTVAGTINIDCGNAKVVIKNYTSINITTNNLTFTNPHANGTIVILKSQGAVTIAASIVLDSMGAAGGAGGNPGATGGTGTDGNNLNTDYAYDTSNHNGSGGVGGSGSLGAGGAAGAALTLLPTDGFLVVNGVAIAPGSGGAGGGGGALGGGGSGSGTGVGGAGGIGGGSLMIECLGAWNFTGSILARGTVGSAGNNSSAARGTGGGGGGGGSGGMVYVAYYSLTANSGTITTTAGSGGAAGLKGASWISGDAAGAGGGGGGGNISIGTAGTSGSNNTSGASGAGGTGGAGKSKVIQVLSVL